MEEELTVEKNKLEHLKILNAKLYLRMNNLNDNILASVTFYYIILK